MWAVRVTESNPQDNTMRALLQIAFLGTALMTAGCLLSSPTSTSRITVPQIEQQVDAALPIGSTRAEIEAWLVSQGFPASYESLQYPDAFVGSDLQEVRGDGYTGAFRVVINESYKFFLKDARTIQVVFLLGPDDRLARRIVRSIATGQ
jgi:hypothetical protein